MADTWAVPGYDVPGDRTALALPRVYDAAPYYEPHDWVDPFEGYYAAVGLDPAAPDPLLLPMDDAAAGSEGDYPVPPKAPSIDRAIAQMNRQTMVRRVGIAAAVGLGIYAVVRML